MYFVKKLQMEGPPDQTAPLGAVLEEQSDLGLHDLPRHIFLKLIIIWSRVMRKPTICICENKDADQLRGNREADQRLCFRYLDSTIPLLPKYKISSL